MKSRSSNAIAKQNLAAYFEQHAKDLALLKENGHVTQPSESPHLAFLQPLWGATPNAVWGLNGSYVIGTVISKIQSEQSDNLRCGIWNAANGALELGPAGAVCIAWHSEFNQVVIWGEINYYRQRATRWFFERRTWPEKEVVSALHLDPKCHWPCDITFPKTYRGRVAKLHAKNEDGVRTMYILCAENDQDHELTSGELLALRKRCSNKNAG